VRSYTVFVYHGLRLTIKYIAENSVRRLAFSVLGDHCYFMKKPWNTMLKSGKKVRKEILQSSVPEVLEWKLFSLESPSQHMYADDLEDVRKILLEKHISPRLVMKNAVEVKSLRTKTFTVHHLPNESQDIQRWVLSLDENYAYKGEGLPGTTLNFKSASEAKSFVFNTGPKR
jgi:hypothetical protein